VRVQADNKSGEFGGAGVAQHRFPSGHSFGGNSVLDDVENIRRPVSVQPLVVLEVGTDRAAGVGSVASGAIGGVGGLGAPDDSGFEAHGDKAFLGEIVFAFGGGESGGARLGPSQFLFGRRRDSGDVKHEP